MAEQIYLPDTNIWLSLAFSSHIHHAAANNWFENVPENGCAFCRMTEQGFLRLATNRNVFGKQAVTLVKAWQMYDAFLDDPRVIFATEPANLEPYWREYTRRRSRSPNLVNDGYLAGFARSASLQIVTFDKGFLQFKKLKCVVLS